MNRAELRDLLDQEGFNPDAYSLEGSNAGEQYVLAARPSGWSTFYSERGLDRDRCDFATEDEACRNLLDRLRNDETTQFHLVVGPLPPAEADRAFALWRDDHGLDEHALLEPDLRIDNPVLAAGEARRRYWVRGSKLPRGFRR